jgi:hypothetical protein
LDCLEDFEGFDNDSEDWLMDKASLDALIDESNHGLFQTAKDEYRDAAIRKLGKAPDTYDVEKFPEDELCIADTDFKKHMKSAMTALRQQKRAPPKSTQQIHTISEMGFVNKVGK